ncbi:sulfatase-like hydrolase/transferase [bacterium]|nr:sulfatase-like hydrolase/transferase [bacterium]
MSHHKLLLVFLATFCCFTLGSSASQGQTPSQRPNIILVNLDDADTDLLSVETANTHFPALAELFQRSTIFTNAHATTPFCAPSRAALFTGKYGFNNGCKTGSEQHLSSAGFNGGYQRFKTLGHDKNELGVWMKRAGYRTMQIGKFHHDGWDDIVPPGWDDFSIDMGAKFYGSHRFTNINVSTPGRYRLNDNQYITHEEARQANLALDNHDNRNSNQPFFLYLAPIAPHFPNGSDLSVMAAPQYRNYAAGLQQPRDTPDFDEADLSDKAVFLQRGPLTQREKDHCQDAFLQRLRSMKTVDDMLGDLVERLKASGQWDNTYLFITSDNGYALGHHRLLYKKDPYERSSGIPLIATAPKSQRQHIASHLIAHIDICPTILELGGAAIPNDVDGKSFAPLIKNPQNHSAPNWRRSIMIENWAEKFVAGEVIPLAYTAERFYDKIHISWFNGEHEFYRMKYDPFQLNNVYYLLSDEQRTFLNTSLLNFRKKDVPPAITLTSPTKGEPVGREIQYAGYMEDNSVPVMARLVVKSFTTQRFFNGNHWQDDYVSIPINASSQTSSINTWKHDLSIFTETRNEFDAIVGWAVPIDDSMQAGTLKFTVNTIENSSLYADINPTINGKTFSGSTQSIVGFHGRYPGQNIRVVIQNTETAQYFNGESMQSKYLSLPADSLANRRWSRILHLEPGTYRCVARSYSGNLSQRKPSTAVFTVQ